jgi:hypothetical protein
LVVDRGIAQPFNQAFRETYSAPGITEWLGVPMDARTLLGLAHSQGWQLRHPDSLLRKIGPYRLELVVFGIFPGAQGPRSCSGLALFRGAESTPLDLSSQCAVAISECLRTVDLLVSVSAFALDPKSGETSASARARRAALVAMFGEDPSRGAIYVEGRYVRRADIIISIATGRASRHGEELAPSAEGAPTVIPYPDPILRRIIARINEPF